MELKQNRVKILYAVGVLLGVAAAFYFGFRILENLSPTTTSAVLFLGFVAFLFAGLYVEAETLDTVFYALSAGSYLIFVTYVLSSYDLGDGGAFVLLAGSSALFVALGYASSTGRLEVNRRRAAEGVAVVLILVVALLGFDAMGAQPTYSHDFNETADVPDDRRTTVTVGETTAHNPFVLSRKSELPNVGGCVYTPEMEFVDVRHDESPYSLILGGGERRSFRVVVSADAFYDHETGELHEAFADRDSVPVETADECPDEADEPKLVVVTGGDDGSRPVPP